MGSDTGNDDSNNTYHIKMAVLEELRHTLKVKRINDELLEHLASTLRWLLRYVELNNIVLPEKDKILLALDRAMEIAEKLPSSPNTTNATHLSTPKNDTPEDDRTIIIIIIKLKFWACVNLLPNFFHNQHYAASKDNAVVYATKRIGFVRTWDYLLTC